MIKKMLSKAIWEKGAYFILQIKVNHEGNSGQELKEGSNLEAGIKAAAMEECRTLVSSSWLTLFGFYIIQGWHCSQWGGPSQIYP